MSHSGLSLKLFAALVLLTLVMYSAAAQARTIIVGSEIDFPPYAYLDNQGNAAGYSIDLIRAAAAEMDLKLQFRTGSWDWAWRALNQGEVDVLPLVARLPGRDQDVDYSVIHTSTDDAFFTRPNTPEIDSIASAEGKEIVVMQSDAAHHALIARGFKGRIITVDTISDGLRLVASGRHDAFLCSKLIGVMVMQQQSIGGIRPGTAIAEYRRDFSFAVKKGTHRELLDQLNQALLLLQANTKYRAIHDRWLSLADPWYVTYRNPMLFAAGIGVLLALAAAVWSLTLKRQVAARTAEVEDLYQNAPCGYHSIDADGIIRRINDTELRWLGYRRSDVVEKMRISNLMTAASGEVVKREFQRLRESGAVRDIEADYVRADGTVMPVLMSASVIPDSRGRFARSRTVVLDMSERKKLEAAQRESSRRVEALSRRIVAVQEQERRQLAFTLHDETSPNLAAISLVHKRLRELAAAHRDNEMLDQLSDAEALIRETNTGVRQMSADLRPVMLDYGGLEPALEEYAQQYERRTNTRVELNFGLKKRLAEEVESALFRITQEALTNCAKHAKAKMVRIELTDTDGRTTLSIADDGIGLNGGQLGQDGHTPGHGLLSMRERAEFAGGELVIASRPQKGTRIEVRL